ncbi:nucleotide disphospho-sugar-binding domain-containing protein [Streptomyces sp. NPDC001770]
MNPLLAVVEKLVAHTGVEEVGSFGPPSLAALFTAAGARYTTIVGDPARETPPGLSDLAYKSFVRPMSSTSAYMTEAADFGPDVVLYDVFSLHGALAGRVLGVPSVSLVTCPGYGSLGEDFVVAHGRGHPALDVANAHYRAAYGVDLLGEGSLPVLFPSDDLSVVTMIRPLSRPPDPTAPRLNALLSGYESTCRYVGPCVGANRYEPGSSPPRGGEEGDTRDFPFEVLAEARRAGRPVLLFSLGTVLTDFRFRSPVGGAPTGREFLLTMLGHLVRGFADGGQLVVVATGSELPNGEQPDWPDNFIVRDFLPQREILGGYADVFLTHHGMNSLTESVLAGVPMVALPGVGDQIAAAQMATARQASVAPWDLRDPYTTVTTGLLVQAVKQALNDPVHRAACAGLRERMLSAGGAELAARLVAGVGNGGAGTVG